MEPQHTTLPVPAWMAQLIRQPAEIALAVPIVPYGGEAWPNESEPQHTTLPVPAWMAQLWLIPAAMALAVPVVPLTESGGEA